MPDDNCYYCCWDEDKAVVVGVHAVVIFVEFAPISFWWLLNLNLKLGMREIVVWFDC